jgi:hypothetical protein
LISPLRAFSFRRRSRQVFAFGSPLSNTVGWPCRSSISGSVGWWTVMHAWRTHASSASRRSAAWSTTDLTGSPCRRKPRGFIPWLGGIRNRLRLSGRMPSLPSGFLPALMASRQTGRNLPDCLYVCLLNKLWEPAVQRVSRFRFCRSAVRGSTPNKAARLRTCVRTAAWASSTSWAKIQTDITLNWPRAVCHRCKTVEAAGRESNAFCKYWEAVGL